MTQLAHFKNLKSANANDYVFYNYVTEQIALKTEKQWRGSEVAGNTARKMFLEALERDNPEFAKEMAPLLQQNGRPLKLWHVQWVEAEREIWERNMAELAELDFDSGRPPDSRPFEEQLEELPQQNLEKPPAPPTRAIKAPSVIGETAVAKVHFDIITTEAGPVLLDGALKQTTNPESLLAPAVGGADTSRRVAATATAGTGDWRPRRI